jgi:peptide/nickel transport system substrate-binding protein
MTGLLSCQRQVREGAAVTVLYDAKDLGPDEDMPAKFLVFSPMVAWNNRGELEGRLAESWHTSADARTATFRLRPGVRWHDGMPVTAHDMKFTLDLLQHPDAMQFAPDSYTVDVHDNLTYTITYRRQDTTDDGPVNDWTVCWPRHLLADLDPRQINSWDFWSNPVGCGPYKVTRSIPQTMMELEANPDYFRGQPKIDKVTLKFGAADATPELLSGNVDSVAYYDRTGILTFSRDPRFRVYQHANVTGNALWWNHRHSLFEDGAVRQALTHAINRPELLQLLNLPGETKLIDFVRTSRQVQRGDFPETISYDPERARQLLEDAGWVSRRGARVRRRNGRPLRFTALTLVSHTNGIAAALYVQDQLKRIGAQMDIVTISDIGLMTSRLKSGEFEAAITGLGTGELASFLRAIGYANASFYELLDKSLLTFDPEEKDELYRRLTAMFQADVPVTILHPFTAITIASKRIRGLDGSPYRGDLTWCMDDLWLEEEA